MDNPKLRASCHWLVALAKNDRLNTAINGRSGFKNMAGLNGRKVIR
jgi:hypothetical protein